MNRESIIINVKNIEDIKNIKNKNIKYLNVDIVNVDNEVIQYLKENGQNYLYAELINSKNGYIYIDYNTFIKAENIINNIVLNMPNNLNDLEKSKYIYISLGKILGYDINTIYEKNETFNLNIVNTINNIWGALANYKATNQSFCKIYLYICSILNIKCEIITINNNGFLCNKLQIEDSTLIVDLTSDIPFIQANFKTRHFSNYNNEIELDKKIGYLFDEYNEVKIEKKVRNISDKEEKFVFKFLEDTEKIINIIKLKPIELGIIYDILFNKYYPNSNIKINNLYINNNYKKEHFILISHNEEHYSYNYNRKEFINISEKELIDNIENNKIGIYLNEFVPINL